MFDPTSAGRPFDRMRPTLLYYCQPSRGIGQLTRTFALAHALAAPFRVVFLCGAPVPVGVPASEAIEIVHLPPLGTDGRNLVSLDERDVTEAQLHRHSLLIDAVRRQHPAVVLIEHFPFGRTRFAGEILSLVHAARTQAHPARIVCGVRDILSDAREDQQRHDDRARWLANRYFDAVLVHGDAAFAPLEASFRPEKPLRVPVHHTGYIVPPRPVSRPAARAPRILVSAGGGALGFPLFAATLEAHARLTDASGLGLRVVAGPFLPDAQWIELQAMARGRTGVELLRHVPDMLEEMRHARLSVSQCGYNTALEIALSGVPALVVPHADAGDNEQAKRAEAFARNGVLRRLPAGTLDPARLAAAIEEALHHPPRPRAPALDGAGKTATLLMQLAGLGTRHTRERRSRV